MTTRNAIAIVLLQDPQIVDHLGEDLVEVHQGQEEVLPNLEKVQPEMNNVKRRSRSLTILLPERK